jgi:hypothetical protein
MIIHNDYLSLVLILSIEEKHTCEFKSNNAPFNLKSNPKGRNSEDSGDNIDFYGMKATMQHSI